MQNSIFDMFPREWSDFLDNRETIDLLRTVCDKVENEYNHKTVFPPKQDIFKALELTKPSDVKVVIIGQDPYHGAGQACGLAFSVADNIQFPPSLVNIFNELNDDIGTDIPKSGNLEHWARQGVLLLNSTLTVESAKPTSHKDMGWERITQQIIDSLAKKRDNIVYILWGSYAQRIGQNVNRDKNLVLLSVHPSPLSSYRGFFGSKPFSKANQYLCRKNIVPIKW